MLYKNVIIQIIINQKPIFYVHINMKLYDYIKNININTLSQMFEYSSYYTVFKINWTDYND